MTTSSQKLTMFALLLICLPSPALAAGSLLRVTCEGADVGAEVHVNDRFKGECPVDVAVPEGMLKLRVVRTIDASHEQVFEQQARIGEGVVKKIEVRLSEPRLTAAAQKVEDARVAVEHAAKEAKLREEAAEFDKLLTAAKSGATRAMRTVGVLYQDGAGVKRDVDEGLMWLKKAAAEGDEQAKFLSSSRYQERDRYKDQYAYNAVMHLLTLAKENPRTVEVRGVDKVKEFVASDPFFTMAAVPDPKVASFSYTKVKRSLSGSTIVVSVGGTCQRDGNLAIVKSNSVVGDNSVDAKERAALGGIAPLWTAFNTGFLRPSQNSSMFRIISVHGQPFPLVAGKRFGLSFTTEEQGKEYRQDIECIAGAEKAATTELVCLVLNEYSGAYVAKTRRWSFDEHSGCLKGGYTED